MYSQKIHYTELILDKREEKLEKSSMDSEHNCKPSIFKLQSKKKTLTKDTSGKKIKNTSPRNLSRIYFKFN